jgi:hypothetical protein
VYPCQYPWGCPGKQSIFSRPADLERHYKNVHAQAEEKTSFPCDYPKCERATMPFVRKDHFRDHLRDFHKEDIGCAKGEKTTTNKEKWLASQNIWLAERVISLKHWRCARCLVKIYVASHGWDCERCKSSCEQERKDSRMKLAPQTELMEGLEENTEYVYDNTGIGSAFTDCDICQNSRWVFNETKWVGCQCQYP